MSWRRVMPIANCQSQQSDELVNIQRLWHTQWVLSRTPLVHAGGTQLCANGEGPRRPTCGHRPALSFSIRTSAALRSRLPAALAQRSSRRAPCPDLSFRHDRALFGDEQVRAATRVPDPVAGAVAMRRTLRNLVLSPVVAADRPGQHNATMNIAKKALKYLPTLTSSSVSDS
jgi:hypothetical protein